MTPKDAAKVMVAQLEAKRVLFQNQIVHVLHNRRSGLAYRNTNGNLAISKAVLDEFRKITSGGCVVWSRSKRHWRFREADDKLGRSQH